MQLVHSAGAITRNRARKFAQLLITHVCHPSQALPAQSKTDATEYLLISQKIMRYV